MLTRSHTHTPPQILARTHAYTCIHMHTHAYTCIHMHPCTNQTHPQPHGKASLPFHPTPASSACAQALANARIEIRPLRLPQPRTPDYTKTVPCTHQSGGQARSRGHTPLPQLQNRLVVAPRQLNGSHLCVNETSVTNALRWCRCRSQGWPPWRTISGACPNTDQECMLMSAIPTT